MTNDDDEDDDDDDFGDRKVSTFKHHIFKYSTVVYIVLSNNIWNKMQFYIIYAEPFVW